jgi:hypothetical protein|tara:strand:- start:834 stop:1226 length:393 start_codon:yes stop_codon:yes gene_type:complete
MIEDDFYATIKLKTGEEIYAKVAASEEENRTMLLISNPITIVEVKTRTGLSGYKVEPWLKTTKEDLFILNLDDILTLSESSDLEMITIYQQFVRDSEKSKTGQPKITREMGFISTVNDAKDILEKLYKKS